MHGNNLKKLAIFGVPRSGTSWLAQLFNSHPDVVMRFQPLFSYGHKNQLDEHSTRAEIEQFYHEILDSTDPFATMTAPFFASYPKNLKKNPLPTHICFKEAQSLYIIKNMLEQCPDFKAIGICRSPMAVIASWMKAPREFETDWDIQEEWRFAPRKNAEKKELYFGYEKWKEVMRLFIGLAESYPERFALVKYTELLHDPYTTLRSLFDFCELCWDRQVEDFIAQSRSRNDDDPNSVYKQKINDDSWKKVLPDNIATAIKEDLHGSDLEKFLPEKEGLPPSLYDYLERPKNLEPKDYWGQVRRTIRGKAISGEQIDMLRGIVRDTLQFSQNDVLLDLCCGNGALTAPFFNELGEYLGVDVSPVLIQVAQRDFQRTGSHEYILKEVTAFLSEEKSPERFTLCSCGGAFQYLSLDSARETLRLLRTRFVNLRKVFLYEIPDASKAKTFFTENPLTLHDHTSALGRWYQADELLALGVECGWRTQIQYLPELYCQSHYRFNLVLTPDN